MQFIFKGGERHKKARNGDTEQALFSDHRKAVSWHPVGDLNSVAAVKGRCPRPLDERDLATSEGVLVNSFGQIKMDLRHF